MDNGVELVKPRSGTHEIVGPDDLEEIPTQIPSENRRRNLVLFCTISILLALGVTAGGKIYLSSDPRTAGGNIYTPDQGTKGDDVDSAEAEKVRKWLNATVTLRDGKQFEVIGQLKHSPDAFT